MFDQSKEIRHFAAKHQWKSINYIAEQFRLEIDTVANILRNKSHEDPRWNSRTWAWKYKESN